MVSLLMNCKNLLPHCVYGEKDGELERKKVASTVSSKEGLVPLLTASIQDVIAKVETLEAEVAALKGS